MVYVLIIAVILIVIYFVVRKKVKHINMPNVYLISGGVKTGKSFTSVALAVKEYRSELFSYYIRLPFAKLFKRKLDKPMLYSNMNLRYVKFNRLTLDILLRKVRIPDRSIVLIDEASLVADSYMFKSENFNKLLLDFVKLFGHYSHGGKMIINTQSVADMHFAFKRSIGSYLWIVASKKHLFFTTLDVREMLYSGENEKGITNDVNLEDKNATKPLFFFNWYYKYYDRYYLSSLTDSLDYYVDYSVPKLTKASQLKCDRVISLRDIYFQEIEKERSLKDENKKKK